MAVLFNVNGPGFKGAQVPAVEAGLIGFYHDGKPWKPDKAAIRALLPRQWKAAFDRDGLFWFNSEDDRSCYSPIYGVRGQHLTTVYAHAVIVE